jgi:serine/threonine protein kinase
MSTRPEDVKAILEKALDIPEPDARVAYLNEACGGDVALRAEIEDLLNALDRAGKFLNRSGPSGDAPTGPFELRGLSGLGPVDAAATGTFASDPPATESYHGAEESIGTLLAGRYKLVEAIGEGGMGNVFLAQQTEPVKRLVAVKVIKTGMDSKAVLARFEAERQALAMMDHPNIAKVLDAGVTENGRPFFVMELVKGVPITQFCDDRKLTPRQRLDLFVPVCNAIQHAHQKGVIHRDIKPSNVLVAMYDDRPVPKVIDFGVAKATGPQLTDHTLVTGFGAIVGTPEYMSPEQASFNQMDVDTRSDVYALGVLLYELLTGSPPFSRKELERVGLLEIFRAIREQEPRRPSNRLSTSDGLPTLAANRQTEPRRLTAMMKGELDWIVMKALEKDRSRRYETANGFAADVQRYLAGEAVQAVPPSGWYRLKKTLRRNRGPVIAASLVLFVLLSGIIGTTMGLFRAEAEKEQAQKERDEKEQARKESDELRKQSDELRRRAEYQAASIGIDRDMEDGKLHPKIELLRLARRLPTIPEHAPDLREFVIRRMLIVAQEVRPTLLSTEYPLDGERTSDDGQSVLQVWRGANILRESFTGKQIAMWRSETCWHPPFTGFVANRRLILTRDFSRAEVRDDSGRLMFTIPLRRSGTGDIQVSPDGRRLIVVLEDYDSDRMYIRAIQLWNIETGKVLTELGGYTNEDQRIKALFSPDGSMISILGKKGLSIWSATDGKLLRHLDRLPEKVEDLSFSPDGRHLVTVSWKTILRWNTGTWRVEDTTELPPRFKQSEKSGLTLRWYEQEILGVIWRPEQIDLEELTFFPGEGIIPGEVEHVQGKLALTSRYLLFDIPTGNRLPIVNNQAFPLEITQFAINKRYLVLGRSICDLHTDKTVLFGQVSEGNTLKLLARNNRELFVNGRQGESIVRLPFQIPPYSDHLLLWAKIVACGELDHNNEFKQWNEGKWEQNRKLLAKDIPPGEFEYYFRTIRDPLYWLRQEISSSQTDEKLLPLLDRLIRLEPTGENYVSRALFQGGNGGYEHPHHPHLAIQDALEASQLVGFVWDVFPPFNCNPSWNIVLKPGLPPEHYELALRWEEARRAAGIENHKWWDDGAGSFTAAAALYRLGRYAEAINRLWNEEQKAIPAQVGRSLMTGSTLTIAPLHGLGLFTQSENQLPAKNKSYCSALQAMCYHKSGQHELARIYLDEAAAQQKAEDRKFESTKEKHRDVPFYREAVELIMGKPPG